MGFVVVSSWVSFHDKYCYFCRFTFNMLVLVMVSRNVVVSNAQKYFKV